MIREKIHCSAIWYKNQVIPNIPRKASNVTEGTVLTGKRHNEIIEQFYDLTSLRTVTSECGEYEQGFLTCFSKFVTRQEAAKIAFKAKQLKKEKLILYSEDIF